MAKLKKRPVVIIIRDGWGYNPYPEWNKANAIHLAKTPVNDRLMREYPHVLIHTSGEDVGLPAGVMGNSEVGHQNIGAGRIVIQDVLRINRMIDSGEFFKNGTFLAAMKHVKARDSNLHLIGLASDALVHSSLHHLYGLLTLAKTTGIASERVFVHNFSDGRDSPPTSGIDFCRQIEAKMKEIGIGRIASVIGRYYAMDRDNRWERVEPAYCLVAHGVSDYTAGSPEEALRSAYQRAESDEFVKPTAISVSGRTVAMADGDGRYVLNLAEELFAQPESEALDTQALVAVVQKRAPLYDKAQEGHYNLISALHKSLRGSDTDAALYWLARMLAGGEDPRYIARRLVRFASEDVGLADPQALTQTLAAWEAYERLGSPEGELALAQAVIYLGSAPKSNAAYKAFNESSRAAREAGSLMPPKHILNAPTRLMQDLGYGEGYEYDHDAPDAFSGQDYFPEGMARRRFYRPAPRGFEREIAKRLEYWEKLRAKRAQDEA
ncbi:MAG: hypothetical protein IH805_03235 [Proteobacteria bacterium]|nr:hypothetical protein [Pseudomonadota bacterium]